MEYSKRVEGSYTIVSLKGEIDLHYSPQVRAQLLEELHNEHSLLVDLSAVSYIDSSGIACLVEAYQTAKKSEFKFGLVGVSNSAMQVLRLARLDKVFPIYRSAEELVDQD